ncbi:hypothetical protein [Azospirillum palustre]
MRRRPPIRDEIRHAAEHHQPVTLTADEVEELADEIETAVSANEERWAKKETEE